MQKKWHNIAPNRLTYAINIECNYQPLSTYIILLNAT